MHSAIVIEDLKASLPSTEALVLCFFNVYTPNSAAKHAPAISLLYQILSQRPELASAAEIQGLYTTYENADPVPNPQRANAALKAQLAHQPTVYIVIDALDEYGTL